MHLLHLMPPVVAVGSILCFLVGLYAWTLGSEYQRMYRFLKDPPLVWINGMPRGFVHVRGNPIFDAPLTSALTQLPCCYCRTKVEHMEPGKAGNPSTYRTLYDEPNDKEFYLDDGTGKILVMPAGAEYILPITYSAEIDVNLPGIKESSVDPSCGKVTQPSEQHLRHYLARHDIPAGNEARQGRRGPANSNGVYKLTEYCLRARQEVSVFATCDGYFGPGIESGSSVLCKGDDLTTLLISSHHEIQVGPRLRMISIACFSSAIVLLGASVAGCLLLLHRHFV